MCLREGCLERKGALGLCLLSSLGLQITIERLDRVREVLEI